MDVARRNFIFKVTAAVATASCASRAFGGTIADAVWGAGQDGARASVRSTKKGLAGVAPAKSGLVTNWYYDWTLHAATQGMPLTNATTRFYPMCWGWKPAKPVNQSTSRNPVNHPEADNSSPEGLENLKALRPPVLFGFNEPDHVDQSNLTAEEAVKAWPAFQGVTRELVSPSCANPMGDWMAKFVPEIERQNLQLDSLGFHSYGSASVEPFVEKLEAFHTRYGRPVWVTEFAVADWAAKDGKTLNRFSVEQVAGFMKGACEYMDRTSWVRGYAWFPTGGKFAASGNGPLASSVLFHPDGSLNELGRLYNSI